MHIIEKTPFVAFSWLNFDSLPNSDGYRFELYSKHGLGIDELALMFYSLFHDFKDEIRIGQFGINSNWGDYCIDTWDIVNEKYDYTIDNKSLSTSDYLNMLSQNKIEPEYTGFCKCLNWDKFLPITLRCILDHTAPYGLLFYIPRCNLVFYFHHTGSFGVYYKELNDEVRRIVEKAKLEKLEIANSSDDRIIKSS